MIYIFIVSFFCVFYAYFGYPILLIILNRLFRKKIKFFREADKPSVSLLTPVHNEESVIKEKVENSLGLIYPEEKLEIVFISDGSTDSTESIINSYMNRNIKLVRTKQRLGKANALNTGLEASSNEIIVFTDASIMLNEDALTEITLPFQDGDIGCVSGEDYIGEAEGEGLYGRYELWLRRLESETGSIVGASGSFYAQRRVVVNKFVEGVAPDFLSVLETVEAGYRAVSSTTAIGHMSCLKNPADEYKRKVRTLTRGMAALKHKLYLLNPLKYGLFSIYILSHKIFRWLVPMFLVILYFSNIFLMGETFFKLFFCAQTLFYVSAWIAYNNILNVNMYTPFKIALFFCMANLAILEAMVKFIKGQRQEIWEPTKR